jgi:uncharacterized protein YgiM (DUF1202 family)
MKTTFAWTLLALVAGGALVRAATNAPATPPAAPAAAPAEPPVTLAPGRAVVAGDNVNVRAQPTIYSEVLKRLNAGETVTVLEQTNRPAARPDDLTQWAKIAIPSDLHVWVHADYVDPTNKTVRATRLNVRAGPGENYSILGTLERGAPIKEISTRGEWIEIEAPADAYAFVAAKYLKQEAPAAAATPPGAAQPAAPAAPATTEAQPAPAAVPETTPVAAAPAEPPAPASAPPQPAAPPAAAPAPEAAPPSPPVEEPPPKRIVQREGIVKTAWSIQAPTPYALVDPDSGRTINYLHTTATNLDLSRYKGLRIIVTGEEGLDERWRNTPVLTIQRIYVLPE